MKGIFLPFWSQSQGPVEFDQNSDQTIKIAKTWFSIKELDRHFKQHLKL